MSGTTAHPCDSPPRGIPPRTSVLGLFGGVVLAVAMVSGCTNDRDQPIAIGVIASTNFLNAARLAISDELAEGPIPGLDTVLVAEGTNRAEPALRYAGDLADHPGMIAVIGHSNSAASIAASQIYNRRQILQLAPTSTATLYGDAGPYSFRMVAGDDEQGRFLADVLADSLPAGSGLAVLYVNDDYGRGLHRSLVEALDGTSLRIDLELPHTEDEMPRRYLDHLSDALAAAAPDAVVWLSRTHSLDHSFETIRGAIGTTPIYGSDGVSTSSQYTTGDLDKGWDAVRFVDLLDGDVSPALLSFERRFEERFDAGSGSSEALTYDAVRLVLSAIRDGARSGDALRTHLEELGTGRQAYAGITGPIEFSPTGDGAARYQLRSFRESRDP